MWPIVTAKCLFVIISAHILCAIIANVCIVYYMFIISLFAVDIGDVTLTNEKN